MQFYIFKKTFRKRILLKNFIKHQLELGLLFRKRIVVLNKTTVGARFIIP